MLQCIECGSMFDCKGSERRKFCSRKCNRRSYGKKTERHEIVVLQGICGRAAEGRFGGMCPNEVFGVCTNNVFGCEEVDIQNCWLRFYLANRKEHNEHNEKSDLGTRRVSALDFI